MCPGATSHGHHPIELDCNACHKTAFGGRDDMQNACLDCHNDELEAADDTHPVRLFTDPRNFEMRESMDAVYCVSCHVEHKPEITRAVSLTIQTDHCLVCHRDVADTRPTHEGLEPGSCAAAGCHNYHDNRALYQEFLLKHVGEPALLDMPRLEPRALTASMACRRAMSKAWIWRSAPNNNTAPGDSQDAARKTESKNPTAANRRGSRRRTTHYEGMT